MADSLLEVVDIATRRGTIQALFGVSFELRIGEAAALLGRNGAGKTTTLRSIVGLSHPFAGRILFSGIDITDWPTYRIVRHGLALVPEDRGVLPSLTVLENLLLFAKTARRPEPRDDVDRVFDLFPPLRSLSRRQASQLSGGEQQMLAIARALVTGPRLLLLDEPFQGLAPRIVSTILESIAQIRASGVSLLLSEQTIRALEVVDSAYVLNRGRVTYGGAADELRMDEKLLEAHLGVRS